MKGKGIFLKSFLLAIVLIAPNVLYGSKVKTVQVIDKQFIMLHFEDGEVKFVDDGKGPYAFQHHTHDSTNNYIVTYGQPLNTTLAEKPEHWNITSGDDTNYGKKGSNPAAIYRKSKVNGQLEKKFDFSIIDFNYSYTHEHYIYVKLPTPLKNGLSYTLQVNKALNTDKQNITFTYNNTNNISEAIHVNLNGYMANAPVKAADLYMWMGDGGSRDYTDFEGNSIYLYNLERGIKHEVGNISFGSENKTDVHGYNLINSPVWHADFSSFNTPGKYKLVVEDVGCSQPFEIKDDIYYEPFKISMLGYYYMRVGEDSTNGMWPVPRRPLYIPGENPVNTKIYITDLHPYSPRWELPGIDTWDVPFYFKKYIKDGMPTNNNAIGGHADALDWDRHLGHVSIIYDLLLPYILSEGKINNDNLGIPESGNGIPDIIDEARNEVDFWLSVRYKGGYGHGISNPLFHNFFDTRGLIDSAWVNVLFQSDNTPVAAWANSANAAMLAYAFNIAGNEALEKQYTDSALNAFNYAQNIENKMLDNTQNVGESVMRGRDFLMTAAAYLFNLTGNTMFEDVVKEQSVISSPTSEISHGYQYNQYWATLAYILTPQKVRYPELQRNMKKAMLYQADQKEAMNISTRPSRRATDDFSGYFKTIQFVQRCMAAHAIADNKTDKQRYLKAMILEADYGLGRNPLNIIQMTTATTSLETKRSVENIFNTGRDDGAPGLHPGHTPYLNTNDWAFIKIEGCPSTLTNKCYPDYNNWPQGEGYFNTRYMFAHSEFTPQQTMRGKTALYAYLYYLGIK